MDAKVITKALNALSAMDQAKAMAYIAALQKQAELGTAQMEQEALLNVTIQNLPFDVWITDASFRLIAVKHTTSKKLNQELGITAEPGHNFLDEIEEFSPAVAPFWRDVLQRALAGEVIQKEYHLKSLDKCNRIHYLEFIVGPYYDSEGKLLGCIGSTRDITKLKSQQHDIQEREQIYKAIIDNARAGIDIIDVTHFDGKDPKTASLFIRNKNMEQYLQSKNKLFITRNEISAVFDQLQFDDLTSDEIVTRILKDVYSKKKSREIFHLKTQSGKYHDIDALNWVIQVNEKILFIRFFRDITDAEHQKKMIRNQLEELHHQNEMLQRYIESNIQLENFAYIAAHDLQAPIRSIAGYTKILEKSLGDKLSEQETQYLGYVVSSAKNMRQLIGDLLDYSRANTQKRQLRKLDLNSIINEIKKDLGLGLHGSPVSLSWELASDIIIADHTKLRQILENLISNAIKFIPSDRSPEIVVKMKDQPDHWLFEVRDNGIGIAKEFHEEIFTIFRRLHGQGKYKGTGIGLALCKQLVEQHDGQIWLKSTVGEGSSFFFTIAKLIK